MKKNIFEKILYEKEFDVLNNLKRWNGLRLLKEETVAHHTFLVILFVRILCEEIFKDEKRKLQVIDLALFHDFSEMFDYDINHEVKYNEFNGKRIRDELKQFICYKNSYFVSDFPENLKYLFSVNILDINCSKLNSLIVKIADWFGCIFYLRKEIEIGNKRLQILYDYSVKNFFNKCDEAINIIDESNINLSIFEQLKNINFYENCNN